MENNKRGNFSGKLGFILAAAGSAVGLGNLWRFPYLAAKYGGGSFLIIYLILAVTFGFSLMVAEIGMGRKTRLGCQKAYGALDKRFGFVGVLSAAVPVLIFPYYCLIGGWIVKYLSVYVTGEAHAAAQSDYFPAFISSNGVSIVFFFLFMTATVVIVSLGVEKGVEGASRIMMPVLIVLSIALAIYSMTRPGAGAGIAYYLVPHLSDVSVKTILAAVGQLFFSMSLAMGIMITYGSYMIKEVDLENAVTNIEIFDTLIAFLAGLMIIPAVFAFSGGDESALRAGPGLMFITMPQVFASMPFGTLFGFAFFLLVLCAALTSAISVAEAVISNLCDWTHMSRKKACVVLYIWALGMGIVTALGYGVWSGFQPLGMSVLDCLDFVTNSILMPLGAIFTCIVVGWAIGPSVIADEVKLSSPFQREGIFRIMIKWFTPICLIAILISSVLSALGIISL